MYDFNYQNIKVTYIAILIFALRGVSLGNYDNYLKGRNFRGRYFREKNRGRYFREKKFFLTIGFISLQLERVEEKDKVNKPLALKLKGVVSPNHILDIIYLNSSYSNLRFEGKMYFNHFFSSLHLECR